MFVTCGRHLELYLFLKVKTLCEAVCINSSYLELVFLSYNYVSFTFKPFANLILIWFAKRFFTFIFRCIEDT